MAFYLIFHLKINEFFKSNVSLSQKEYNGQYPNIFRSEKTDVLDKCALDLTGVKNTKIYDYH
jgi:hypothetical protein